MKTSIFVLSLAAAITALPTSHPSLIDTRSPPGFSCAGYYDLQPKTDTCASIAQKFGITAQQVQQWNTFSFNCTNLQAEFTYPVVCIKALTASVVGPQTIPAFNLIVRPEDTNVQAWWVDGYVTNDGPTLYLNDTKSTHVSAFALSNRSINLPNGPIIPYPVVINENYFGPVTGAIGVESLLTGFDFHGDYLMFDNQEMGRLCVLRQGADYYDLYGGTKFLWEEPGRPASAQCDGVVYAVRFMKVPVQPKLC